MLHLKIAAPPLLGVLVIGALAYLVVSAVSVFSSASEVRAANTAPPGAFAAVYLGGNAGGDNDYTYNWDFVNTTNTLPSSTQVDWGMRFIFAGGGIVDVDYVKDRLDGVDNDPSISPELKKPLGLLVSRGWASSMYAYMSDGPGQTGTKWDQDSGIKNHPGCNWNFGHMRIYARSDQDYNYHPSLGNYVVASTHVDKESVNKNCDIQWRSMEADEQAWIDRIEDSLLDDPPYDWAIGPSIEFYNNSSSTGNAIVDIGGGKHKYQSDGMGTIIEIGQADD